MFKKRVAIMLVVCLLVSLVTVTGVTRAGAKDATIAVDFSTLGYTNGTALTNVTKDDVTLTFSKGSGSSAPAYQSGTARLYQNNTMKVEAVDGSTITKIQFTATQYGVIEADTGEYSNGVWTGSASSVTFTNKGSGSSNQARLQIVTITLGAGASVPSPTTAEEIWDLVNSGALSDYQCTLTGVVTWMVTPYNSTKKEISVYIVVDGLVNKPFECYKMVNGTNYTNGNGIEILKLGDTITVSGKLKKYNSTIEFDQGCKLENLVSGTEPEIPNYNTAEEVWNAANSLPDNALLPGGPYTLTGVVTEIPTAYNNTNITVDIVVDDLTEKSFRCFKMVNGANITEGEGIEVVAVGDTIKVSGELTKYNNLVEFAQGCTLDELTPYEAPASYTAEELWDAANELASGGILPGGPYELSGVVAEVVTAYNSQYGNITVNFIADGLTEAKPFQCYRMSNGDAIDNGRGVEILSVGDTITVKGYIKKYVKNNVTTIEFFTDAKNNYTCTLEALDHIPHITSASLSLGDNIAINFKVNETQFDSTKFKPLLNVTFDGEVTPLEAELKNGVYVFEFGNLTPDQMTTTATAVLIMKDLATNGTTECNTLEYSIADYCYNQLRNEANADDPELLKLLVDLLVYGDAAQEYTGVNLSWMATQDLTNEERALGSQGAPDVSGFGESAIEIIDGSATVWKAGGLNLMESISIRVKFTLDSDDVENCTLMVSDDYADHFIFGDEFEAAKGDNTYYAFFKLPSPADLFTTYTFVIDEPGTGEGSVLTYSAAYYVKSMLDKLNSGAIENAELKALIETMTNYCLSALDYAG